MPCDYRNELLRFGERSTVREEEAKGAPTDNVLNETWYQESLDMWLYTATKWIEHEE